MSELKYCEKHGVGWTPPEWDEFWREVVEKEGDAGGPCPGRA